MNPLLQLSRYGQSYWLDNLTRGMITDGTLGRRVGEQGLRGVTSNPAIFHKAIAGSQAYDAQLRRLVDEGRELHEIYEQLVVTDVQDACDLLRPVYEATQGLDGFISLEVSPYLAYDTAGTMREARRLFQAVGRPNVLIKIPGTPAGVPAIEEMLYEGLNINVTLLFAVRDYEAVARAYVRALERRLAAGKPVRGIASVASFFLSRIDVLVDQLLGQRLCPEAGAASGRRPQHLFGKVAVANARLAYQRFTEIFSGRGWQALEAQGARVQRPLWASTSTKNPLYSDVCYVEPLIAPHTVNTMPDETIAAFADHGLAAAHTLEAGLEEARQVVRDLAAIGIDLDVVTQQLQQEGVQKFIEPFDALLQALATKRQQALGTRAGRQSLPATAAFKGLDGQQFGRRLWARDPSLWTANTARAEGIRQRLGWLDSVSTFAERTHDIRRFATEIKEAGFTHAVLLGMGGSSLCPEVCSDTFGPAAGWPRLLVLDDTNPDAIREVEARVELARTLFIVASKSGTTTETLSFYRYFWERLSARVAGPVGAHFIAITDPGTPLAVEASRQGFRRCFANPADIGGRFSALSYFGLVPMALLGIDVDALLAGVRQMQVSSGPAVPTEVNPGLSLGSVLGLQAAGGHDKVTLVLDEAVGALGVWVEQLLAESTGKEGRGLVPVEGEPLGRPEVYSADRLFVHVGLAGNEDREVEEQLAALEAAGHPVVRMVMPGRLELGAEFLRWELATATAGALLRLNPFDEPNVAESKQNTSTLLQAWQQHGTFGDEQPRLREAGVALYGDTAGLDRGGPLRALLPAFVGLAQPPDYLTLLPYFRRTPARHARLQALRVGLRDRLRVATALGYGPRYLHSTGQLHKGGPNTGVFVLFTADTPEDLAIPGQPFGFGTLQRAQALGDYQALASKGRRVIRLHLGRDMEAGLDHVAACLQ